MADGFDDGGAGLGQAAAGSVATAPGAASIPGVAPTGTVQSGLYSPTAYDPNNPQPYRPTTMPGVEQPVPNVPPPEQPIRDLGATTKAGGVAYLGDQLLRGYMQGRAVSQANQAIQLNKTSQGLQSNLNQASQDLYQLAQSGVDPKSQQFQDAQNRVQAAWQSWMQFAGQHIQGMKTDKKTGQPVPQGNQNLLQRMFNQQDPAQIAPAWYEAMQQTGPPVLHQIAPMLTDEYRAKAQQRAQTTGTAAATGLVTAQTAEQTAKNQQRVQQLIAKPDLSEDEQSELTQLQTGLAAGGKGAGAVLNFKPMPNSIPTLDQATGRYQYPMINERGQSRMMLMPVGYVPPAAALKGLKRYEMDNGVWTEYDVNGAGQELTGTRHPVAAAAMNPGTVTETSHEVAGPLGPETLHSTTIRRPATGGAGAGAGAGGSTSAAPASFGQAISTAEGYGTAGTIPTRANNPGNLELGDVGHGQMRAANGQMITVFRTPEEGQAALDKQLGSIFSGQNPKYPPTMTLDDFGKKYSGGDAGYGARIAQSLGVLPSTTLGQLAQQGGAGGTGAATAAQPTTATASFPGGSVPRMYGAPLAKAQNTLSDASKAASIANSPDTANNGTAQYLLLTALFHSAQGRSPNMTELNKIMGTAGWGASLEGWGQRLVNGKMPDQLFDQIVRFANTNKKAAATELDDLVTQAQTASGRKPTKTANTPPPPPAATGFDWVKNFTPAGVQ